MGRLELVGYVRKSYTTAIHLPSPSRYIYHNQTFGSSRPIVMAEPGRSYAASAVSYVDSMDRI